MSVPVKSGAGLPISTARAEPARAKTAKSVNAVFIELFIQFIIKDVSSGSLFKYFIYGWSDLMRLEWCRASEARVKQSARHPGFWDKPELTVLRRDCSDLAQR